MSRTVIILGAGDIRSKLHYLNFDCGSPALIPINTRPLATYVIDFYLQNRENTIYLVVNKKFAEIVSNELMYYKDRISIVSIDKTNTVNESLNSAINSVELNDTIVVNVVTTIPVYFPALDDVLLGKSDDPLINCSYVKRDNKAVRFFCKDEKEKPIGSKPFQGVFCVDKKSLIEAVRFNTANTDLLSVVKHIGKKKQLSYVETEWLDCGHEANYYEARQKLISCRGFNHIQIDSSGILQKSSFNIKKLSEEINYIEELPNDIKIFFPRIFERPSEKNNFGSCTMEYYAYPNVSELFLFWDISDASWHKLFKRIELVLNVFSKYRHEISKEIFLQFYFEKVSDRIKQLASQSSTFDEITKKSISVNGQICRPFEQLAQKYYSLLDRIYDRHRFSVMHGDFCFNNILFDYSSGLIKLIDARGSFGDGCVGIYGDPLYDVAKLAHSAKGGYDYFVNNLFTIEEVNAGYNVSFKKRKCGSLVERLCDDLISNQGYNINIVSLIMSTLFLSMPPLHSDNEERQKAMYLHGLFLFNSSLEKL